MIKHNDPWTICDSCGFKVRKSETRRTWDGRYVCAATCWDEKYPKTGVRINTMIRVNKDVRPAKSAEAGTTTLAAAAAQFATSVQVSSVTGFIYLSDIGIVLDDGLTHWTHILSDCSTTTLTLNDRLPSAAASGNTVYVPGLCGEEFGAKISPEDM